MPKSDEELKKEQEEAKEKLDAMFKQSKPKNLREGLGKGVNNIVSGAVGGVGVAVLAPSMGLAAGLQSGGLLGGALGAAGGAVVGAVGAAGMIVGGALSGVSQIVRGVAAVPEAVMAPRKGKWWNEAEHAWVYTDLSKLEVPENDDDLLGSLEAELDAAGSPTGENEGAVKDPYYYELLEVDPKAEPSAIKRKYYVLARKYHPDKNDSAEAAEKFKGIAEAYQVLSDPELRARYDKDGRDALTGDKTGVNDDQHPDPALILAFFFGSDQFNDYFGRLATSTSAMLGDSTKIDAKDARKLQERRVARLALKLVAKITPWTQEDYDLCKVQWKTEADELVKANYGWELVQALGKAYEVAAVQFLGSMESGLGMPGIAKWADGQQARLKKRQAASKNQYKSMMVELDAMKIQMEYNEKIQNAPDDESKANLQQEMEKALTSAMLNLIWTTTVVDITATVHEVCQMVFFDQSVDKDTRKRRAHAVKNLGEIFQATTEPAVEGQKADIRTMFEEATLAATVETMKRKDEAAHHASFTP